MFAQTSNGVGIQKIDESRPRAFSIEKGSRNKERFMIDHIHTIEDYYRPRMRQPAIEFMALMRSINPLLLLMLVTDLCTPILIWKGILPASLRWLSHVAAFTLIVSLFTRMILKNKIHLSVLLIIGLSIIGVSIALYNGQGFVATAWGWWIVFQFPIIGIYASIFAGWPDNFLKHLWNFCITVLVFQVSVQLIQYIMGERMGDNLAGTFGEHGTGILIIFMILVYCLALGRWLTNKQWFPVILVIFLGGISSLLAELKFFLLAIPLLSGIAVFIYTARIRKLSRLILFGIGLIIICTLFILAYNALLPGATPLQNFIQNPETLLQYVYRSHKRVSGTTVYYDIGRNFALEYGWDQIKQDPITLLFGFGLGAGSESKSLGTVGIAIERGLLGMTLSTNLLVFMQEFGVFGLILLACFIMWLVVRLTKIIHEQANPDIIGFAYGLILFTMLWPLWLWYNMAWTFRVPMLLYWISIGYLFKVTREQKTQV